MKILILVRKATKNKYINKQNYMYSRSHLYGILLQEYFKSVNIDAVLDRFIYDNKRSINSGTVNKLAYKDINHIILIDMYGFYKKNINYIQKLKSIIDGHIISIGYSNKYIMGEDMSFFSEYSTHSVKHGTYINYFSDPNLCFPKSHSGIWILVDDFDSSIKDNILRYKYDNKYTNITIRGIKGNAIYEYDINGNRINVKIINNYLEYYDIFCKIDLYFVTDYVKDPMIISDLSMCNTLIISKKGILSDKIIKKFGIIITNNNINWESIIQHKNIHNSRDYMIQNGMITDNIFGKVHDYVLRNHITRKIINTDNTPDIQNIVDNNKINTNKKIDMLVNNMDNNKHKTYTNIKIMQNNLLSVLQ